MTATETPNNKGKQPQRIAERLVLLREYLIANASRKRAVRIQDMKQYLNDKDDNCGIKPIYRALAILTTDFNMDLEYSEKSKGWILKNPPFTQHELRLIVDSIQASKFITQEKAKQLSSKTEKDDKLTFSELTFFVNKIITHFLQIAELQNHFESAIDWIGGLFDYPDSEVCGLPWAEYYDKYHETISDRTAITNLVKELMQDPYRRGY